MSLDNYGVGIWGGSPNFGRRAVEPCACGQDRRRSPDLVAGGPGGTTLQLHWNGVRNCVQTVGTTGRRRRWHDTRASHGAAGGTPATAGASSQVS